MSLPANADCADLCTDAILKARKERGPLFREQIAEVIRPIITAQCAIAYESGTKDATPLVNHDAGKPKRSPVSKYSKVIPPSPEDVTAYSAEYGYPMNGQKWCDHYAAKGWVVSGRAKMKDWRAAVRNWANSGWGQENGIALKKLPPKAPDARYAPEPKGDWRAAAKRIFNLDELPKGWESWATVPPDYRGKIVGAMP